MKKFFLFDIWKYPKDSVVMITGQNAFKPSYRGKYIIKFHGYVQERDIIRELGIHSSEYRRFIMNEFNAEQIDSEYFMYKNIDTAKQALEWMESRILMKKMTEKPEETWESYSNTTYSTGASQKFIKHV